MTVVESESVLDARPAPSAHCGLPCTRCGPCAALALAFAPRERVAFALWSPAGSCCDRVRGCGVSARGLTADEKFNNIPISVSCSWRVPFLAITPRRVS